MCLGFSTRVPLRICLGIPLRFLYGFYKGFKGLRGRVLGLGIWTVGFWGWLIGLFTLLLSVYVRFAYVCVGVCLCLLCLLCGPGYKGHLEV